MRKNDAFDAKIVKLRLTKIFIAIFAPDERLPSSATMDFNVIIMFKLRALDFCVPIGEFYLWIYLYATSSCGEI